MMYNFMKVRVEVLTCIRDVCSNLMVLRDGASNEAEMQFAFRNPVVRMLCAIHGYYPSVEQKVNTPGITQYVTEKCAADYVCYTLHHQHQEKQLKLVAVIIETKTNASYSQSCGKNMYIACMAKHLE